MRTTKNTIMAGIYSDCNTPETVESFVDVLRIGVPKSPDTARRAVALPSDSTATGATCRRESASCEDDTWNTSTPPPLNDVANDDSTPSRSFSISLRRVPVKTSP